jgi:hypothetical protein
MDKIISVLILFMLISCNKKDIKHYDLPSDSLINVVISRVIKLDTVKSDFGFTIAKRLCPYTLDYSFDIKRDSLTPPPSIDMSVINPISPKILIDFINMKLDSSINKLDTSFFALQITNSNNRFIDTLLFKDFKFSNIKYFRHKDYCRLDSIMVFFVPIFSSDKKFVYINYHYNGFGIGTILKRKNNDWIKVSEFDTWIRN